MTYSAPAAGDAVIGVFDRRHLSGALAATHRAGFGPHARVFDAARGDLVGQLGRAGLRVTLPSDGEPDRVLIVVTAPGRAAAVAQLMAQAGARSVHGASRGIAPPVDAAPLPHVAAAVDGEAGTAS